MVRRSLTPGFRWLLVQELGSLCPRRVTSFLDRSETIPGVASREPSPPTEKANKVREISTRHTRVLAQAASSGRGKSTLVPPDGENPCNTMEMKWVP